MRVAVDARELEGRRTGVGRVLQGLLEAWPIDELVLLSRRPLGLPGSLAGRGALRTHVVHRGAKLPGSLWEQLILPGAVAQTTPDAFLAPGYGMPRLLTVPTAVCMHDCAPFALRADFGWREGLRRRWSARDAARRAAFLFMGSQFAAAEAQRHLGVDADRCLVAPWGLAGDFAPPDEASIDAVRARYRIDRRTVLFVGSGFRRRATGDLSRRVSRLAEQVSGASLALVGRDHAPPADNHVRHLGYVPEADLAPLYAGCGVVAYPSTYEGFGLPVLEALACSAPVVATRATALAEVFAGRATLVPHDDDDAWVAALADALRGAPGPGHDVGDWARAQSWGPTAQKIRSRLERAVEAAA